MAKTLLRCDCIEDKNGDLLISISGLNKVQKEKILNTIALSITQTGLDLSCVKEETPIKRSVSEEILSMDGSQLKEYVLKNRKTIKDYRTFGYVLFKIDHPMADMKEFAEADCLSDDEWEEKVKTLLPVILKEITAEDGFIPAEEEERIPFTEEVPTEEEVPTKETSKVKEYNPFA